MAKQLRYTTFAPGELEERLRELAPKGAYIPPISQLTGSGNGGNGETLLKAHCCEVHYPDGRDGDCRYERGGPQWHVFHMGYDNQPLPRQIWMQSLRNDVASIESKAHELAASAYQDAITRERQDYFARGSEPSDGSRKKDPTLYRLSAGKAKEWAGKYALCQTIGQTLSATGPVYDSLDRANAAWHKQGDIALVVGCCNRLDRCWQLPRFNSLYAAFDPRPHTRPLKTETMGVEAAAPHREQGTEEAGAKALEPAAPFSTPSGEEACVSVEPNAVAFTRWITEVTLNMETLYGLDPDDLPDCAYADWFASGMTAEEAAREAMALFLDA